MAEQAEPQAIEPGLTQAQPAPAKNKGGRPKVAINWEVFDAMCISHCTLWEIADYFDCSTDSVQRAVKREFKMSFAAYYNKKAAFGKTSLRRKQFQTAMSNRPGSVTMQVWLGKQWLNQTDTVEVSGPGGGPIPHEIEIKDRATLEREISSFLARVNIAERIRRASTPLLNGEGESIRPPEAEPTG